MERPGTPQLLPLAVAAPANTDDGERGLPQLLPSGRESGGSQAGSTASLRGVAPSVYAAQQLVRVASVSQQPPSQPQSQASSIPVEEHASAATAVRHTSAVQLQPRSGSTTGEQHPSTSGSARSSAPPSEAGRRSNSGSVGGGGYSSGEPASPLQAESQPADPPQQPQGETRPAPGERRGSKVSFFSDTPPVNDASVDLGEGVMAGYRLREIYDRLDVMHRNRVTRAQLINALKADEEVRRLMHLPARIAQASPAQTDFERLFQALDAHNTRGISWEDFRDTFFGCTVTQFRPKKKPTEIPRRSFVKRPGCSFFTYEEQEQQQQARRPEAAHPDTQPRPRPATPTTEPDTPQEHSRDVALHNSSAQRRPEQVQVALIPVSVPVSVPAREVSTGNSAAGLARSISADSQPQLLQKVSTPSSADDVVIRAAAPAHVAAAQRPQTSEEAYIQAPTHRRSAAEYPAVELRPSAQQQQQPQQAQSAPLQQQQQQQQQHQHEQLQQQRPQQYQQQQQQQQTQPLQQAQSAPQQVEKERWQKQQQLQPPELTARRSHAARPTPSQAQQGAPPSNAPSSSSKPSHPQAQQQQPASASQVPQQQSVEPLLRSTHEVPESDGRPQQPLQQAQSTHPQQQEEQQQQQQQQPQMRSQPAQWQDRSSASQQQQQYQTQPLPPQPHQQPWLRPVESNDTVGASTTTFASPTFPPPPPATPASPPGRQRQRFSSADIELRALPTSVARPPLPTPTATAAHPPGFLDSRQPAAATAAAAGAAPPPGDPRQALPARSSVPSTESSGRYQQYIVVEAASSRGVAPVAAAARAQEPLPETRPGSPASALSAVAQLSDSRQVRGVDPSFFLLPLPTLSLPPRPTHNASTVTGHASHRGHTAACPAQRAGSRHAGDPLVRPVERTRRRRRRRRPALRGRVSRRRQQPSTRRAAPVESPTPAAGCGDGGGCGGRAEAGGGRGAGLGVRRHSAQVRGRGGGAGRLPKRLLPHRAGRRHACGPAGGRRRRRRRRRQPHAGAPSLHPPPPRALRHPQETHPRLLPQAREGV